MKTKSNPWRVRDAVESGAHAVHFSGKKHMRKCKRPAVAAIVPRQKICRHKHFSEGFTRLGVGDRLLVAEGEIALKVRYVPRRFPTDEEPVEAEHIIRL